MRARASSLQTMPLPFAVLKGFDRLGVGEGTDLQEGEQPLCIPLGLSGGCRQGRQARSRHRDWRRELGSSMQPYDERFEGPPVDVVELIDGQKDARLMVLGALPSSTKRPARSAPRLPDSAGPKTSSSSMLGSGPLGIRRLNAFRTPKALRRVPPARRQHSVFGDFDVGMEVPVRIGDLLELDEHDVLLTPRNPLSS
jgi:hypothetical protein